MNMTIPWCLSGTVLAGLLVGCGQSGRQEVEKAAQKLDEASQQLAEASDQFAESINQRGEGLAEAIQGVQKAVGVDADVVPIDFRELKSALPTELDGFTAGKAIGERTRVMGIWSSQAEVRMSNDQGSILIRITDTGSVSGWAALAGRAASTFAEVDRETEHGFERSGMVDGIPTQEAHDSTTGASTLRLFYADRFSIELQGQNVGWEAMEAARAAIDMKRLDELKARSVETEPSVDEE